MKPNASVSHDRGQEPPGSTVRNRRVARPYAIVLGIMLAARCVLAQTPFSTIDVHEPAQLDRENWPIQVGVPVDRETGRDVLRLVRVCDEGKLHETRFQTLTEIEPVSFGDRTPRGRPLKILEIAFQTDLTAGATRHFRLYTGTPEAEITPIDERETAPALRIETGERLARTLDTGVARFVFHRDSGQLLNYRLQGKEATPGFVHEHRDPPLHLPVHGGADLWSPPHAWSNVRAWDVDDATHQLAYEETAGPIAWRMVRTGHVPNANQTDVSLSYTVFAGMPFILESTRMHIAADMQVHAVRNNQLVFSRGEHTHGIYMDHDHRIRTARGYDPDDPEKRFHLLDVPKLAPDIPFIGMFHEQRRDGIGMTTLGRVNQNTRGLALPQDAGASYYFFDGAIHANEARNFFYFVRAEIFPAVYRYRTAYPYWYWYATVVPGGSVFSAQSAILVFPLGDDETTRFDELTYWIERLRRPPRVEVRRHRMRG